MFSSNWDHEYKRLNALCSIFDRGTFYHIQQMDPKKDWKCAEIGAGTGSVTEWLCSQIEDGEVLAIDINTKYLSNLDFPNLTIHQADITNFQLEEQTYDFIHTRMVLTHLVKPQDVIASLVKALKPGGSILLEELECVTGGISTPHSEPIHRAYKAMNQLMTLGGNDPSLGRRINCILQDLGLNDIDGEGRMALNTSDSAGATLFRLGLEYNRKRIIDNGILTNEEINVALDSATDGKHTWYSTMAIAVWGRKPLR